MKSRYFTELIERRKSPISGRGVFARASIKKGSIVHVMSGELITLQEMVRRVDDDKERGSDPLGIDDDLYLDLDELSRSINHSCAPNSFLQGSGKLIAIKDIDQGEEITFDYSTTMNDNKEYIEETGGALWTCKCKCQAVNCRKVINQFKTLPSSTKEFYLKNKYAPDFILRRFGQLS